MPDGSRPYRFVAAARTDLTQGVAWYEDRREGLGRSFAAHVERAVRLIVQAPDRWPVRRGMHRYVLRRFPYTIVYRIAADEIVIVAVAHQRLDPGTWEER